MAYVTIPKDLSKVKNKVFLNLTKRQLVCMGFAAGIGVPFYFLMRDTLIEEEEPTEEEKIPFTIAGNGEVEDNIMDDPSKEFFTVKTRGGNTFFLVIDRARNSENVYMLSMIDEYDLQEFLDDEERNGKQEEETPAVVLPETKPEPTPDVEIEEPKEESSGGMNKILLLVFVAALGGAGAFFYFYIYKPKPKEETPQSENLETDQSLATVNEENQSGNENGT